jgi:CheY-like chemotaxis protein
MPKCIGIADLNRLNRTYFSDVLRHFGYDVFLAISGPDLVRQSLVQQPDVLMLHMTLPELTISQSIDLIRSKDALAIVPIIVHTSHMHGKEITAEMMALGIADFVQIPLGINELWALMDRVIGRAVIHN